MKINKTTCNRVKSVSIPALSNGPFKSLPIHTLEVTRISRPAPPGTMLEVLSEPRRRLQHRAVTLRSR